MFQNVSENSIKEGDIEKADGENSTSSAYQNIEGHRGLLKILL